MSKAFTATTFIVIVLGLLVILIILGAFGGPLKKASEGAISKVKSAMGIEEKVGAIVPGTVLGKAELMAEQLVSARQLAQAVVSCAKLYNRKQENTPCVKIKVGTFSGTISEKDFREELSKLDDDIAGTSGVTDPKNYEWSISDPIQKGSPDFNLCAVGKSLEIAKRAGVALIPVFGPIYNSYKSLEYVAGAKYKIQMTTSKC